MGTEAVTGKGLGWNRPSVAAEPADMGRGSHARFRPQLQGVVEE